MVLGRHLCTSRVSRFWVINPLCFVLQYPAHPALQSAEDCRENGVLRRLGAGVEGGKVFMATKCVPGGTESDLTVCGSGSVEMCEDFLQPMQSSKASPKAVCGGRRCGESR